MDKGRAVVGVSVIGALVLAAGLVVETSPSAGLSAEFSGACVSGTFPEGTTDAASWFMTDLVNDSGHDVRVRSVRVATVHGVRLEHLAVASDPATDAPGLIVTEDDTRPPEYGRTVAVDSGVVVPARGHLDVTGRMVLDRDRQAGYVRGVTVTEVDRLGRLRTVVERSAFGVGVGDDHEKNEFGCDGA